MYSPDYADLDPRNPANLEDTKTYKVCDYKARSGSVTIIDILDETFATEDEAKAALFAISDFKGDELDVVQFDSEGDEMVVFCAEWDADERRYVKA